MAIVFSKEWHWAYCCAHNFFFCKCLLFTCRLHSIDNIRSNDHSHKMGGLKGEKMPCRNLPRSNTELQWKKAIIIVTFSDECVLLPWKNVRGDTIMGWILFHKFSCYSFSCGSPKECHPMEAIPTPPHCICTAHWEWPLPCSKIAITVIAFSPCIHS